MHTINQYGAFLYVADRKGKVWRQALAKPGRIGREGRRLDRGFRQVLTAGGVMDARQGPGSVAVGAERSGRIGQRCRHCHGAAASRPRRRCSSCFGVDAIRACCPASCSKFARRGVGHGNFAGELAQPTEAMPGTPDKVAVLEERARLRLSLWHPQDAAVEPETTIPLRRVPGSKPPRSSRPRVYSMNA